MTCQTCTHFLKQSDEQGLCRRYPPTLFLHGFVDMKVPWWSMNLYYQRLQEQGISSARHTDWLAGHEWLEQAPELILDWFRRYP